MSLKKTFLLGIGAQKAGTTWLHRQLCKNNFFDPGFTKEYHTFDSIYASKYADWTDSWLKKIAEIDDSTAANRKKKASLLKRLLFVYEPKTYFDYFKKLANSKPEIELVCDITPSYSILDTNAFTHIKRGLNKKGFQVKVIFLMRDPVERIWSARRMKRRHAQTMGVYVNPNIETSILKSIDNEGSTMKTDYKRTIQTIDNIFHQDDIFYGFFEDLFTQSTFERIKSFLNLDLTAPDFDESVNSSPKDDKLSEELKKNIIFKYRDTYNFVNQRFDGAAERFWTSNYRLAQS